MTRKLAPKPSGKHSMAKSRTKVGKFKTAQVPPSSSYIGTGKATVTMVKLRSRLLRRCNRSLTRAHPNPTVAADSSGDIFPRELPEGYAQSSSLTRVRTVGFGPRPRGATIGDWTFGKAPEGKPQPQKHLLTCLQGSEGFR